MSIAVLNQVYDEARRLAVAGSVVAQGDFRLKKLIPPLQQAGAKAPVFAKVADAAAKVVDGPEDTSAESLLELTSLTTAVLYTQGETGLAGELQPIESTNLGGETAQTSARLLKPLLEALSSTGSGRMELVKDAHERGVFRDLRLVMPALKGLDDPYAEIADFLAEKVLPMYGQAILPELRRTCDVKGTKGHPRRLKLMHGLDPAGTRGLIQQALDGGSKEVKVAAISCLGADQEDLDFLVEQAAAKAQDVRSAAYEALARVDDPAAAAAFDQALAGKDAELAARAIAASKSTIPTELLVNHLRTGADGLPKLKDKKAVTAAARRLVAFIHALPTGSHPAADQATLGLFNRRAELANAKGEAISGSDVVEAVITRMGHGPKELQAVLARAHAALDPSQFPTAFWAGRSALPATELYESYSPYVAARPGKRDNEATTKREAILNTMSTLRVDFSWESPVASVVPLDPRWLALAVRIRHVGLIHEVGRPGDPAMVEFLRTEFDAALAAKTLDHGHLHEVVAAMVRHNHPDAVRAVVSAAERVAAKDDHYVSGYAWLIPHLPKTTLPEVEALMPKLKGWAADCWLRGIEELRRKN